MKGDTPRWSLSEIYPAPMGAEFQSDLDVLRQTIAKTEETIDEFFVGENGDPGAWLAQVLPLYDRCTDLFENLESFAYASYSVDTADIKAQQSLNDVGALSVPLSRMAVRFRDAVAALPGEIDAILASSPDLSGYRYILEEARFFQTHQLSPEMESLAADLGRSGADAWSRLQETVSSTLSASWPETEGRKEPERKSVVELRALAYNPDRSTRRTAYHLELDAWKSVETPLAFAINGVKGATATLNGRRGWSSTLERSTRQNRLSEVALSAMIDEMRRSLPMFRRYFTAKARLLGLDRLSFYDLFAPVGRSETRWSYTDAIEYIHTKLAAFDPDLGSFVYDVRDRGWIDAEPRAGKVGGGYCIDFPIARASRILVNFDGSYDGMSTLAHEIGHAWHSELLRDLPASQRSYPMTLAETASIFNETLVFYNAIDDMESAPERLYVLEQYLQNASQVIVDILSRFEFESTLMERRAARELPASELCEAMIAAQKNTYGDGLNHDELHQYMWAVKGHYYRGDLAFYNFPYAFGQLFGLSLYDQFETSNDSFADRYRTLLGETGRHDVVTVARMVGFDIEAATFWRGAFDRIEGLVAQFEEMVGAR